MSMKMLLFHKKTKIFLSIISITALTQAVQFKNKTNKTITIYNIVDNIGGFIKHRQPVQPGETLDFIGVLSCNIRTYYKKYVLDDLYDNTCIVIKPKRLERKTNAGF